MTYTEIIGNIDDVDLNDRLVDSISIDWFEAFNKIHRKISEQGEDIKVHLGDEILSRGIRDGDILSMDDEKFLLFRIAPAKAIIAEVEKDHLQSIAKLCYEVGNTHTTMFYGSTPYEYIIPYSESMMKKLSNIHGVSLKTGMTIFDFNKALSNSINNHHH